MMAGNMDLRRNLGKIVENMKTTTLLRTYIDAPEILMIPGVPDALGAKLAERAGFKAVFLSGYAASASLLGAPDVGLLTMTEMAECARRIADAVAIPVFADGDNGHGNATNVMRTMRQFESTGIAAVFFEDQVSPKRCGHMSGKQVIPASEMVAKIKAAVDARIDPDLLIMARTDALGISGIDDAIERMHRYLEAGADLSFVEAPTSVDEMRRITREIAAPNMANVLAGGKTPVLTARELQDLGFAFAAYPTLVTYAMTRSIERALAHLQSAGTPAGLAETMEFEEFNAIIGLNELRRKETEFYAAVADR
jgi:2,3-dimethylmalate lyase